MAERRRYTRKKKVAVVMAAAASSVLAAAQAEGINESTIRYWMKEPEFAKLRERTREDLADEYRALAHLATDRLRVLLPTMDARDATVLASMAVDKAQLLSGQATSRSETRDLTTALEDHEWDALQALLREAANAGD